MDVSWGRDDDMRVTYGLFQNSQRLDLIWNNIVSMTEDSTNTIRSFRLTITFNPTNNVEDGKYYSELQIEQNNQTLFYINVDCNT